MNLLKIVLTTAFVVSAVPALANDRKSTSVCGNAAQKVLQEYNAVGGNSMSQAALNRFLRNAQADLSSQEWRCVAPIFGAGNSSDMVLESSSDRRKGKDKDTAKICAKLVRELVDDLKDDFQDYSKKRRGSQTWQAFVEYVIRDIDRDERNACEAIIRRALNDVSPHYTGNGVKGGSDRYFSS